MRLFLFGGEGEIRTLAPLSRPTPLAGAPLHRLEYFSMVMGCFTFSAAGYPAATKIIHKHRYYSTARSAIARLFPKSHRKFIIAKRNDAFVNSMELLRDES